MLGLTTDPYYPNEAEMKILKLMSEGCDQKEMADEFKITPEAMRWRVTQLRLNLGAHSNGQMMFEFGAYKERMKAKKP